MSIGLDPTTVEKAAISIQDAAGLSWPQDREALIGVLNRIRNHLYNQYADLKLFENVFHCICISSFPDACPHRDASRKCHQGFTLPEDTTAIESAWEYGQPLLTRSRWREAHTGIDVESLPRTTVTETAEQRPTERALRGVSPLMIFAHSIEDAGQKVVLEVRNSTGGIQKLDFNLDGDAWVKNSVPVQEVLSVALPAGRHGLLTLAQQDGYELSIYAPYESVPSYRKFRVASNLSSKGAGAVLVQGPKRYRPVAFDFDLVEVGDAEVLALGASYFRYRNSTEAKSLRRAAVDKNEMQSQLNGLVARHRGHAVQDNPFLTAVGRRRPPRKIMEGYRHR